ncbi:MAG: metalloregulator ArsR/SmtB family transcription factor [Burkholderiaceae bacterium]|jgi:DNA-binding transcriptional ArsR family regulator
MSTSLNSGLHALNDPTRLAILQRLAQGPLAVVELTRNFEVTRPAISQHLKILKDAGLVSNRVNGTQRIYEIDPNGIEALKAHFDSLWTEVLINFHAAAAGSAKAAKEEKRHARIKKPPRRHR